MIRAVIFDCFGVLTDSGKNLPLLGYIAELKTQGYKIGLISNIAYNWIQTEFLNPDEQQLFDAMALSYEVGVAKPDSRIYQDIIQKLSIQPSEVIIVDDTLSYVTAAQTLGMKGVVYQNFLQCKAEVHRIISYEV